MESNQDREQRIREIAYRLWEEEGRPEGGAERHWFAAEAVFNAEEAWRNDRQDDNKLDRDGKPGA
jgi:hypothetical protein